jgi:hypothetical protein
MKISFAVSRPGKMGHMRESFLCVYQLMFVIIIVIKKEMTTRTKHI